MNASLQSGSDLNRNAYESVRDNFFHLPAASGVSSQPTGTRGKCSLTGRSDRNLPKRESTSPGESRNSALLPCGGRIDRNARESRHLARNALASVRHNFFRLPMTSLAIAGASSQPAGTHGKCSLTGEKIGRRDLENRTTGNASASLTPAPRKRDNLARTRTRS